MMPDILKWLFVVFYYYNSKIASFFCWESWHQLLWIFFQKWFKVSFHSWRNIIRESVTFFLLSFFPDFFVRPLRMTLKQVWRGRSVTTDVIWRCVAYRNTENTQNKRDKNSFFARVSPHGWKKEALRVPTVFIFRVLCTKHYAPHFNTEFGPLALVALHLISKTDLKTHFDRQA